MGVMFGTTSCGRGKARAAVVAAGLALTLIGSGCTADGSTTESIDTSQDSAPLAPKQDPSAQETSVDGSATEVAAGEDGSEATESNPGASVVSVASTSTSSSTAPSLTTSSTVASSSAVDSTARTTTQTTSTTVPVSTTEASGSSSTSAASTSSSLAPPTTAESGSEGSIVTIAIDSTDPALQGFDWPSDGELGLGFVVIVHPVHGTERLHAGQDFRLPKGSPVLAARDGTVVSASLTGGYGNFLVLDHGQDVQTRYAHLDEILVTVGDEVSTGQLVARSGSSGTATGPVLFFQMLIGDDPFDPLLVLPPR